MCLRCHFECLGEGKKIRKQFVSFSPADGLDTKDKPGDELAGSHQYSIGCGSGMAISSLGPFLGIIS